MGGIAIAVGVALWEHEPFREWAQDTWNRTSTAFHDLADGLENEIKQKRREAPFGAVRDFAKRRRTRPGAAASGEREERHQMRTPSPKRRNSGVTEDLGDSAKVERANDVSLGDQGSGAHLRRRYEGPNQVTQSRRASVSTATEDPASSSKPEENLIDVNEPTQPPDNPDLQHLTREELAEALREQSPDFLLERPTSPNFNTDMDGQMQSSNDPDLQHFTPEELAEVLRAHSPDTLPPRSTPPDINIDALHSHPIGSHAGSRRDSAISSDIDIVSAPGSVHPGDERDDISNIDMMSDSSTETLSQISELERISDAEGAIPEYPVSSDGDDVASVASNWSEVESVRAHEQ